MGDWSEKETRCAVCLRPFPTDAELALHAEKECDPSPCWCVDLCWAEHGGDCDYPDELDDDLALFLALRTAEEQRNTLAFILNGLIRTWDLGLAVDFTEDRIDAARRALADVGEGGHLGAPEPPAPLPERNP